jgi:hypothetical protein
MTIPEGVEIRYTSPDGGTVLDITGSVLYADAYFEMQSAAVPGSFHITVKDPDRQLFFTSGGVVEMWIGGKKMFGGFVSVPTKDFFFAALDTSEPVTGRRWSLDGVDFNYLLDKRVLRNTSDYTHSIPDLSLANSNDKHIISLFGNYFDLDFSGNNNIIVTGNTIEHANDFTVKWKWPTQGSTMRQVLDALVIETTIHGATACVYWLDANAAIRWVALQTTAAPWGFSDYPSVATGRTGWTQGTADTVPTESFIEFIGWREGSASEDGSSVINEVYVWGGSPLGSSGTVRLAHRYNQPSIDAHGRWQMAEAHPGEDGFKSQAEVNARANALISGVTSGTSPVNGAQGLVNPDTQYNLTWFAHDVPLDGNDVRMHLIAGDVVTLNLWSFSEDNGETPFAIDLPLRQMRITFPTLPSDNPNDEEYRTYVQFQGTFGLQMSDPVWWWAFLRQMRPAPQAAPIITTDNGSGTYPYGSYFTGSPKESPNGSRTDFSIIPTYWAGSLEVYIGGIQQVASAFTELVPDDPSGGTFRIITPPSSTDTIVCRCRTG